MSDRFGKYLKLKPIMVEQITITIDLPKLTHIKYCKLFAERLVKICQKELGISPEIEYIGVKYD